MFESYIVAPMRDLGEFSEQCEPQHADYWALYGVDADDNAFAIGDFSTKSDAEFIKEALKASNTGAPRR